MTQPATMGWQTKLSMAAGGTAVGSYTEAYEITNETLKKRNRILDTDGTRATRSHASERTRFDVDDVAGQINFSMSPLMMTLLLPRILGAAGSGNTYALADTLPTFDVLVERNSSHTRYVYASCYVNKATFRSRVGSFIDVTLDLIGVSETKSATAYPAITIPVDPPFIFTDSALTLVGATRKMMDFELTIDNRLLRRYTNSITATSITPMDRIVTLTTTNPFTTDETDLQQQALAGSAGSLVFTGPSPYVTTFTFATLQAPDDTPTAPQKTAEVPLKLTMQARMASTTRELVVTHVTA